ncbi:MAG TPA: SpoIID/LytB domain-containing protein [Acidimicrobiales bacterium]|nr:SpoIID/LytB domain-containing protein [Acidimicrobiales bacterium]
MITSTILLGAVCASAAGLAAVTAPPPAAAATPSSVTITGHGFGHGRGMGQYGAYGYALAGDSAATILGHFYGGTTLSATSSARASSPIAVRLDELDDATSVSATGSNLTASWSGGSVTAPQITVTRTSGGPTVNGQAASGDVTLTAAGPVQVTLPGGSTRSYLGSIVVKSAVTEVWDVLALDDYVAGVVPAESPASWGTDGLAALEAQAVAARSYALAYLASSQRPAICDTTACQVYSGDQDVAGDPAASSYTTYSDEAVRATSGQVLLCAASACGPTGSVALAEFSSSTGGYSAGGAFPAVVDDGDATSSNPNHTWTVTVQASAVEAAWPSIGTLEGVAVTARNGLGDMGGRATSVSVSGTSGAVQVTGATFAAYLGLRSDWFQVGGGAVSGSGTSSGQLDGYWILTSDGAVHPFGGAVSYGSTAGQRLASPVVAMAPTADQSGYWEVAGDGGIFSFGGAAFHGSTGGMHLNRPIIGMASTPSSKGYWLFASDGGMFSFGDARFLGSTGGMRLNRPIVGMAATADGGGYWLVASDGGIFAFGDARFLGSTGAMHLNAPIVGMVPAPDGSGYTLVASDGGIFCFGSARYLGSLPAEGVSDTVRAVTPTPDGGGYEVLGATGRVYPFGDAPFEGNLAGTSAAALDIFGHHG